MGHHVITKWLPVVLLAGAIDRAPDLALSALGWLQGIGDFWVNG